VRHARPFALITLAVTALVAAGCIAPAGRWVSPSRSGKGTLTWSDCKDVARQVLGRAPSSVAFDCATLKVPKDWHATGATSPGYSGPTLSLSLLRARSTKQQDPIGSLLINPGGPGASGIEYATYLGLVLPAEITRSFDIVGFDPRGVGRSGALTCFSPGDLDASFGFDPDPRSDADFAAAAAISKRMDDGCYAKYGEDLTLYSTEQAARDIDAIRQALGEEKTTYLGYSYGTLLGAVYAELFPTKIRAMVLDGAVDPRQGFIAGSETQAKGFEHAFDNFASWCRANQTKCPIGPDARASVMAALDNARTNPVAAGDRKATAGWVFTAIVSAMYSQSSWPTLAQAISRLGSGSATGIFQLADNYAERDSSGHYSNLFDANAAVNCADDDSGVTVAKIRELQGQWRQKYPLFGGALATGMLTCAQWPTKKRDPYPTGPATGSPPIVVVGTTGDPATPYEQTPKLADMLGTGVVLTWEGEGHTAYPQTRCITLAVDAYLLRLTAPPADTTCPAR
jgi:pimeloyl-ACP methyl ester carboxylesterase